MNVLINASSANMGGAVTYLKNLLKWFPTVAPQQRFIVYLPEETRQQLTPLACEPVIALKPYPFATTGGIARLYFDQVRIPQLVREHKADVLFSSTGFATFLSPCPQALLVRNAAYFSKDFQQKCKELGRSLRTNTQRRCWSLLSIRAADMVLFPTAAMRGMVAQYISLGNKHTEVIHYGFDRDAFFQDGVAAPEIMQQIRVWKDNGYKIILNVSYYAVHKNFETLVEALPHLIRQGLKIRLITTLSREKTGDKAEYDLLMQRIKNFDLEETVVKIGYIPYEQVSSIYQAAHLFVFPSFTESFGQPLVEAMAAGLPIVAADTPVNREVCGESGEYFRTFDAKDCAEKIGNIIRDPDRRTELAIKAQRRANAFSWTNYAESFISVLCQAHAYGTKVSV